MSKIEFKCLNKAKIIGAPPPFRGREIFGNWRWNSFMCPTSTPGGHFMWSPEPSLSPEILVICSTPRASRLPHEPSLEANEVRPFTPASLWCNRDLWPPPGCWTQTDCRRTVQHFCSRTASSSTGKPFPELRSKVLLKKTSVTVYCSINVNTNKKMYLIRNSIINI